MRCGLLKQGELIHWALDIGQWTGGGCWLRKKKGESGRGDSLFLPPKL